MISGAGSPWSDRRVRDDGNLNVHDREHGAAPDEIAKALVVGMHGDGDVAEHGLRTGRRDDDPALRFPGDRIAYVPEVTRLLLEIGFFVAQRRQAVGAPVDDPMPAIDELLVVEPDERLAHGP
jgi:hypothetical protein